jgi:hypothetical protein
MSKWLVAELIGDMANLLERADTVAPAVDEARQALIDAAANVIASLDRFQAHVNGITEQAKRHTAEHIIAATNQTTRRLMEEQATTMRQAGQAICEREAAPPLLRLTASLQRMVQDVHRPRDTWLTHAAAATLSAIVSAGCSAALVLHLIGKG